jgi:hypothetical protein
MTEAVPNPQRISLAGFAEYLANQRQILLNLLNNATRYTPDGGSISLSASTVENELLVVVADNGAGIDPKLLPQLFNVFAQAPQPLDRSRGGLGLGLAIAPGTSPRCTAARSRWRVLAWVREVGSCSGYPSARRQGIEAMLPPLALIPARPLLHLGACSLSRTTRTLP